MKYNLKSAYKRAHSYGLLVVISLIIIRVFTLLSLRLFFEDTYFLCTQCIITELICNMVNTLLSYRFWNPKVIKFTNKDLIFLLKINNSIKRELAVTLLIDISVDPDKRENVFYYIDDLITLGY